MGILKHYVETEQFKIILKPNDCVALAVNAMHEHKKSCVLLEEDQKIVGIFTQSDLANRVIAKQLNPITTLLSSVMTKEVLTFDINDAIDDCWEKMKGFSMEVLPVLSNGKLVAVVSMIKFLQWVLEEMTQERSQLIHYITG